MPEVAYEIELWTGASLDEPAVLAAGTLGELRAALADWARAPSSPRVSPDPPDVGSRRRVWSYRGTKAIWQIFYGVLHNGGVKAWRGLVAWPNGHGLAAPLARVTPIDQYGLCFRDTFHKRPGQRRRLQPSVRRQPFAAHH